MSDDNPRYLVAPVRLTALTLRGVGSYLHGARLEVKPLTVLCGPNGSGKSTWFKVLNLLRASFFRPVLEQFDVDASGRDRTGASAPIAHVGLNFELKPNGESATTDTPEDRSPSDLLKELVVWALDQCMLQPEDRHPINSLRNSFLMNRSGGTEDAVPFSCSEDEEKDFGRQGTVGITMAFASETGITLTMPEGEEVPSVLRQILNSHLLPQGGALTVRITVPEWSPTGEAAIAVLVNNRPLLSISVEGGTTDAQVALGLDLCSDVLPWEPKMAQNLPAGAIQKVATGIIIWAIGCLTSCLGGCFHIGAIRKILGTEEEVNNPFKEGRSRLLDLSSARSLSPDGSDAHLFLAFYHDAVMFEGLPLQRGVKPRAMPNPAKKLFEKQLPAFRKAIGISTRTALPGYYFENYFSAWMRYLVDVRLTRCTDLSESISQAWVRSQQRPHGFRLPVKRSPIPEDEVTSDYWQWWDWGADHYSHPCMGTSPHPVSPDSLSAGFHQVAPVVIQSGLLRKHELFCIENPEVHLHPALQTRITEFLIGEARIGKCIMVETHSDLVIMRTLRAILEEDLPQEQVNVAFCSLKEEECPGGGRVATSVVTPLRTNEGGQISNWPEGFLDERTRESERLLDLMYGNSDDD